MKRLNKWQKTLKRETNDAEQWLAGDAGRRAEKLVAKGEAWLRPPSQAGEAGR